MKNYLFTIAILISSIIFAQAQSTQGVFVSPILEVSEMNANVTLGTGVAVGTNLDKWHVAAYGIRTTNTGQVNEIGEQYNLNLTTGGLWITYQHPVSEYFTVNAGARMGIGQVEREWNFMNELGGLDKADVQMLTPQLGVELMLSDRLSLGYTSSFRWALSMDAMPDVSTRDLSAMTNAITLKFALFGSLR